MSDAAHSTAPSTVASPGIAQRASDVERQAVVDHLRTATSEGRLTLDEFEERVAIVLEARTFEDMAPVTADLPAIATPPVLDTLHAGIDGPVIRRRRLVSVFANARHAGSWGADPKMTVVAVFGHSHVDLATCQLPPAVTSVELRTFAMFAGIEVVVPPGAVVDIGGFTIFGGRQLRHRTVEQTTPGVRVSIRSYGAFGGVLVRSARQVP